ncbi:MAG TPA: hypothetical protein VM581_04420 [Magnetospirillaceae bacterium]|nr:hypothetical protein [Magnetospirillaceae bacterium]
MRYRIAQAVLTGITLLLLAPVAYFGFVLALGKHKYQEKVKVGDKAEIVDKSISYFREGDFWRPVWIVVAILLVVLVMFYVSHKKSRLVPGAILGTIVVLAACIFGQKLWPKGDPVVFLHGLGAIALALAACLVVFGAVIGGEMIANRKITKGQ